MYVVFPNRITPPVLSRFYAFGDGAFIELQIYLNTFSKFFPKKLKKPLRYDGFSMAFVTVF